MIFIKKYWKQKKNIKNDQNSLIQVIKVSSEKRHLILKV